MPCDSILDRPTTCRRLHDVAETPSWLAAGAVALFGIRIAMMVGYVITDM
jgi:hypothetical protein